jgi:hypothetical protein
MDQDGAGIPGLDRFEEGVQYQATIHVTAQGNWTFVKGYPFAYPPGSVESQEDLLASVSETIRVVSVVYKPTQAPKTVTDLDLSDHISAPVTGATAMRSPVPGKENQHTGSVAWQVQTPGADPAAWETMPGAVFQVEQTYRAVVTLYAGPGWVFDPEAGVSYTGQTVSWSDEARKTKNVLDGLIISFPATENTLVTDLDLTGKVPQPVTGGIPVTSFPAAQYTGTVAWSATLGGSPLIGLFQAGTAYTAQVTLTAAPGYTFAGNAASSLSSAPAANSAFKHDKGTVTSEFGSDTAMATIAFPETGGAPGAVTDLDLTPYLAAPVTGETPQTAIPGSAPQYTGTVTWTSSGGGAVGGQFEAGKVYTATVRLTAKPGCVFAPDTTLVYAGVELKAVSNDDGSITVSIGSLPETAVPYPW